MTSSNIPWQVAAEEYRQIGENQRARFHVIAGKLERCEPLTNWEISRAAAMLRLAADELIPTEQPKKKGANLKLDYFSIAMQFWMHVKEDGMTKNAAYGRLADEFSCHENSIKNVVKAYGDEALRMGGWTMEEGDSE